MSRGIGQMVVVGALVWSVTALRVAADTVDFNTPGDLTSKFSINWDPATTNKYTQVSSGGLGNSGAVDHLATTDMSHTTAVYNQQSYDFSGSGDSVTVSEFILRQNATQSQTPLTSLGILSDVTERIDAGRAGNSYASIRIDPASGGGLPTGIVLSTETKVNGGSRVRVNQGITATLTAGDWYFISATFTYNSASNLSVSAVMEDWGTTGAAFQSTVFTLPSTLVALSGTDQVNGDSSVWAGFRSFHEGGANLDDNFSVVPEPACALFMAVALGVGIMRRPRTAR